MKVLVIQKQNKQEPLMTDDLYKKNSFKINSFYIDHKWQQIYKQVS